MGHIGTKNHGVQWDNLGTLGHVSQCAPHCPNMPQCSVLQYNCDRLSPPKTAVLDYIGEITGKSIKICRLYIIFASFVSLNSSLHPCRPTYNLAH